MPQLKDYKYHRTQRKKRGIVRMLLLSLLLTVAVGGTGGVFLVLAALKGLPDPLAISELKIPESTKIYDRTGVVVLYEIHGEEKRTVVPFDRISHFVKDATIVAEDFNFYEHKGVDVRSIIRAFIVDITNWEYAQGASTITQQLVRSAFLTPERSLWRKLREVLLAIKLEQKYTKEEIFAFYLNHIPYGSNAYGIESAAQTFFGKPAEHMTLNEAAILAALIKAPSYYSPWGQHQNELMGRKNYILDRMAKIGFISQDELERAQGEPLALAKQKANIKAPHFVMYVKDYLEQRYGASQVERGGLSVYTTLDWNLQQKAEDIVARVGEENEKKYHATNAALVAVDPKNGQLLAMVGSRDYFDTERGGNFNVITSPNRQPGSAFKPIVYAEFFRKGFPPATMLFDVPTEFSTDPEKPYHPVNYDDKFRGPVAAQSALAQSLNLPSVKVLYLAGIDDVVRLAHDLGITSLKDKSKLGLSLVLGGGEVSPLDMVYAYSVFANDGARNDKTFILKVADAKGNVLEEWKQNKKEVLEKNVARTINAVLSSNELRAPVFGEHSWLHFEGFTVAAKTGTTQNYRDAWVVGYTPSIAAAVWVGNNDGASMDKGGAGISAGGPLFHQFLIEALNAKSSSPERFPPPDPILSTKPVLDGNYIAGTTVKVDKDSGKLATPLTPPHKVVEKTFREVHTILKWVNRHQPLGDAPGEPGADPQFALWEEGISAWLKEHPEFAVVESVPPSEIDDVHTLANAPHITIVAPSPYVSFSEKITAEVSVASTFPIKEVDFSLNGVLFATDFQGPYRAEAPTQFLGAGPHTLVIRAYDMYDNIGTESMTVMKDQ